MFTRIKRALVDSYIGAIGLGYLLAQVILYFVGIFSTPVAYWVAGKQFMNRPSVYNAPPLLRALPQLIDFVLLFCFWYILLRWLYLEKPARETSVPVADQEQPSE